MGMLPSEFKENWKILVTEKIIDGFSNFYDNQFLFVILIQLTFRICLEKVEEGMNRKAQGIMKFLKISTEQENAKTFENKLIKLFTDFELLIFKPDDTFYAEVKEALILQIKLNFKDEKYEDLIKLNEDDGTYKLSEDLSDMLESPEFVQCLDSIFALATNMKLNNPPISLELFEYSQFKNQTEGEKFEGFEPDFYRC